MLKKACSYAVLTLMLTGGFQFVCGQQGTTAERRMAPEDQIRVGRLIGIGPRARAATPIYSTSAGGGVKRAQDWNVVSVTYDTAPEWVDDLLVQFYVLSIKPSPETRQNIYSLYKKAVRYGDIERGRDHRAMTFLRPAAVKRYGEVVACAAVFTLEGKIVDEKSETSVDLPEFWWRNPLVLDSPSLTVREGYLMNRMESPWAMVNPDDYEVIK